MRSGTRIPGFSCLFTSLLLMLFILSGCAGPRAVSYHQPGSRLRGRSSIAFSIQAGAFASAENAARLTESLRNKGIRAYYFKSEEGVFRVRFGDFPSEDAARRKAESLKSHRLLDDYLIVAPGELAASRAERFGNKYLRKEILKTARNFIDVPYRWGGTSAEEGFDCSGFVMAVYDYNGLKLPRSSLEQYRSGIPIMRDELLEGDLVFFATSGGRTVSHVGIYAGKNQFIHAPSRGKRIRIDSLSNSYFRKHYVGARRYL